MCGIAGYVTKEGVELNADQLRLRKGIFEALLWQMQERGTDSTGFLLGDTEERRSLIRKRVGPAGEFLTSSGYEKFWAKAVPNPNVCIGHTRAATTGSVSRRNAHPFRSGSVVGVHNGWVHNFKDVDPKAVVDSEAIFTALNRANDPKDAFARLKGKFAVAWFDESNGLVRFARGGNPLALGWVEELQTWFFCSLEAPLRLCLIATGYDGGKLIEFPDDEMLTLDPMSGALLWEKVKWGEVTSFGSYSKGGSGYKVRDDAPTGGSCALPSSQHSCSVHPFQPPASLPAPPGLPAPPNTLSEFYEREKLDDVSPKYPKHRGSGGSNLSKLVRVCGHAAEDLSKCGKDCYAEFYGDTESLGDGFEQHTVERLHGKCKQWCGMYCPAPVVGKDDDEDELLQVGEGDLGLARLFETTDELTGVEDLCQGQGCCEITKFDPLLEGWWCDECRKPESERVQEALLAELRAEADRTRAAEQFGMSGYT